MKARPERIGAGDEANATGRSAAVGRGVATNGTDHRGRADDGSIFEDVAAASGASDCSSVRAGCGPPPMGDRRPARLRLSYRAGRNVASIGSGTEHGQATGTPGRRCVPGDVAGFDAMPGAGSPGFFEPWVSDPRVLGPGVLVSGFVIPNEMTEARRQSSIGAEQRSGFRRHWRSVCRDVQAGRKIGAGK